MEPILIVSVVVVLFAWCFEYTLSFEGKLDATICDYIDTIAQT